jgi:hypothetical protein
VAIPKASTCVRLPIGRTRLGWHRQPPAHLPNHRLSAIREATSVRLPIGRTGLKPGAGRERGGKVSGAPRSSPCRSSGKKQLAGPSSQSGNCAKKWKRARLASRTVSPSYPSLLRLPLVMNHFLAPRCLLLTTYYLLLTADCSPSLPALRRRPESAQSNGLGLPKRLSRELRSSKPPERLRTSSRETASWPR